MDKKASRNAGKRIKVFKSANSKTPNNISTRLSEFVYNTECPHCVDNAFRHSQITNGGK